jgi:hypothetical protein
MVRIENRQDVADLAAGVTSEFLNSTDRDQKWSVGFRHAAYPSYLDEPISKLPISICQTKDRCSGQIDQHLLAFL